MPIAGHRDAEYNSVDQVEDADILEDSDELPVGTRFIADTEDGEVLSGWKAPSGEWVVNSRDPEDGEVEELIFPSAGLSESLNQASLRVDGESISLTQPTKKIDLKDSDDYYPTPDYSRELTDEEIDQYIDMKHADVDFSAASLPEISGVIHEITEVNPNISFINSEDNTRYADGDNLEGFRKTLEGIYQMYKKYPWMQPVMGVTGNLNGRRYGEATAPQDVRDRNFPPVLGFNTQISTNGDADELNNPNGHFANPSDPARYVAHHEMGHVFDASRVGLSEDDAEKQFAEWASDILGIGLAEFEDMSYNEIRDAFEDKGGISNYGLMRNPNGKSDKGGSSFDKEEVYAEAIADVEQNGRDASPVSIAFYRMLLKDSHDRQRYLAANNAPARDEDQLHEFLYGKKEKHQ